MLLVIGKINFATAMTYYAAADGVMANTGTDEDSPWPVQTAVDAAVAGDNIILRGGVYLLDSTITIHTTGTESMPIRMTGFQGEQVILDAGDASTSQLASAIHLSNHDGSPQYWVIENLEITGGRDYGVVMETSGNTIINCNIHGAGSGQVKTPDTQTTVVTLQVTDTSTSSSQSVVSLQSNNTSANQQTDGPDDGGGDSGGSNESGSGGCSVAHQQMDMSLVLFLLFVLFYKGIMNSSLFRVRTLLARPVSRKH